AFRIIALIAFGGFAVHALLPLKLRLGFFAVLSALGIVITLGAASSAWLFLLGGGLIGICHLKVPVRTRAILLLTALAVLAGMRAGWVEVPWSTALWPILGSMFMFR